MIVEVWRLYRSSQSIPPHLALCTYDNTSHKIVPKKGLFQCDQIRSGTENREETFLRDGGS
eukprot:scaffold8858_cov144-Skeletonema_menzelii.AAC.1